jgi:Pentapeptide repeats (8 copies)
MITLRGFAPGIAVTTAMAAGTVVLGSAAASAATCPTVAPGTGIVTPAPTPGVSWSDCDLAGADLSGADLAGAGLDDANLEGANLNGTYLEGVSSGGIVATIPPTLPSNWLLEEGYLIGPDAQVTNANLTGASLAGAFLSVTDFAKADLRGADLFGDNVHDADLSGDTWTGATCPDGTSASSHGGSCASALTFRSAGVITPKPGSTVKASEKRVIVHFKLTTSSGAVIPASVAAAIGAAKQVRITLAGPGIKATSAYCSWDAAAGAFACTITDPRGIEKGKSHTYTITVAEQPGTVFQTAPRLGKAANPETIHFG